MNVETSAWSEESFPVPVTFTDTTRADTLEDCIKERIQNGQPVAALLKDYLETERREIATEAVSAAFCIVEEARNKPLVIDQLRWASGITLSQGVTAEQLAGRHGISKQGFQQGAKKLIEKLRLRKAPNMRSEKAKRNMKERNYRRAGG